MLKAGCTTGDGRTLILLGLSEGNLTKLREGKPIHFLMKELVKDSPLHDMAEDMAHLIGPGTRVSAGPRSL